jgi:hypothetical protein
MILIVLGGGTLSVSKNLFSTGSPVVAIPSQQVRDWENMDEAVNFAREPGESLESYLRRAEVSRQWNNRYATTLH